MRQCTGERLGDGRIEGSTLVVGFAEVGGSHRQRVLLRGLLGVGGSGLAGRRSSATASNRG